MSKTHLTTGTDIACHRFVNTRTRKTDDYRRVSCLDCRKTDEFTENAVEAAVREAEAFANQTPKRVARPFGSDFITCSDCGNDTFRYAGRSLDYHNHVCAKCGKSTSTLTETGMCR
jgi:hypothetical protein